MTVNPIFVKTVAKGVLALAGSALVGSLIKAEKQLETRIDDHFDDEKDTESDTDLELT